MKKVVRGEFVGQVIEKVDFVRVTQLLLFFVDSIETLVMPARAKEGKKKPNGAKKVPGKEKKEKFILVRDKVTNRVIMVRLDEVVSAKPGAKLSIGDTVTHGSRNKKVRGMIILVGESLFLSVG